MPTLALTAALALSFSLGQTPMVRAKSPELSKAVSLYNDLEFDQALAILERLKSDSATPKPEAAQALIYIGLIQVSQGDEGSAKKAFEDALRQDSHVTLPPDSAPKVQKMFEQLAANHGSEEAPEPIPMKIRFPSSAPVGGEVPVEVGPLPEAVHKVVAFYRTRSGNSFKEVVLTANGPGRFFGSFRVPPALGPGTGQIELYAEGYGVAGAVLARSGSEKSPATIAVLAKGKPAGDLSSHDDDSQDPEPVTVAPYYETWWFWTAVVGTVAVAGGTYYFLRGNSCAATSGNGCVTARVQALSSAGGGP